jgi:prolyl-tRNA editing enzyme YbaK/EbsC (Cys-tRNA(Pro) deacylase)
MGSILSPSAQRVQDALRQRGFSYQVIELHHTSRTAVDAAQAVGCGVEQIVKSLIFRGEGSGRPILVMASGANRVSERRLAELVGEAVGRPDADFVRMRTGFSIGGVPPIGHPETLESFIDEDLMQFEEIWAAAGTPNAVFSLAPADLSAMTGGQIVCIKE